MTFYFFVGTRDNGVVQFNKKDELVRYHIRGGNIVKKELVYENGAVKPAEVDNTDNLEGFLDFIEKNDIIMA